MPNTNQHRNHIITMQNAQYNKKTKIKPQTIQQNIKTKIPKQQSGTLQSSTNKTKQKHIIAQNKIRNQKLENIIKQTHTMNP